MMTALVIEGPLAAQRSDLTRRLNCEHAAVKLGRSAYSGATHKPAPQFCIVRFAPRRNLAC
jgi:hypothetical protein